MDVFFAFINILYVYLHILFLDRCPNRADGTVKVTETVDLKVFEWENQAFKFFGTSDAVYVTCEVTVCETQSTAAALSLIHI